MDARMQEIQEKEQRLQELQAERETGIQLGQDNHVFTLTDSINAISSRLNELYAELDQEAAAQVRIQAQEEKVTTLTLPYDFNELYNDSTANDTIIEVVQLFLREANDEHNKEIQALIAQHREEIRAAGERELQLKRQNDELQQSLNDELNDRDDKISELKRELEAIQDSHFKLTEALNDAESKRDAAVRDKEAAEALLAEKQAHIDTLRDEIAIGASKAINVTNINPSDRLAALVEQSKSAKIKSAREIALENSAPFRGPVIIGDVVAPPLSVGEATFQPNQASDTHIQLDSGTAEQDTADHQEVADHTFPLSSGDTMENGVTSESGTVVTRQEFEALKADVESLKRVQGMVA